MVEEQKYALADVFKPKYYSHNPFFVRKYYTGVYRILYTPNGAAYIGSSKRCIANRINWHIGELRKGRHQPKFQEEWDNGVEADWKIQILELCIPEICRQRELFWLLQEELPLNEIVGKRIWSSEYIERLRRNSNPKSAEEGAKAWREHIANQSTEEMRRRSLLRKNIKRLV